jgi:hydroxypyruvate reductase/glycerate 2-kinase
MSASNLRADARAIWDAAVAAVEPMKCVRDALMSPDSATANSIRDARRILVVGGGKAGAAMAAGVEAALADRISCIQGLVNVPAGKARALQSITLSVARPAGVNEPTAAGVEGVQQMLRLVQTADSADIVLALISGGGSALLPAPADGISLEDKLAVTRLLNRSSATIAEMNCVRKHLSRIKGGGLAALSPCPIIALIISDVIGDPLDVIASGPTVPDPSTYAEAISVLRKHRLFDAIPPSVREHLTAGVAGQRPETLKQLKGTVTNCLIAGNRNALMAAEACAQQRGYHVSNWESEVQGETAAVAHAAADALAREPHPQGCLLIGGETTVTLPPEHGIGGRNTEFVLAALISLRSLGSRDYVVLSGGTDGEDGPTDAAGAIADESTIERAAEAGLDMAAYLARHDSYSFFDATGDLLRTGLTETNVMDVRVLLRVSR